MAATLNETPSANRIHIGFFGRRNSGKSSLVNALAGHHVSIVSEVAGTTTDLVYKAMEIHPIGPCVIMDTAGFDDEGELGRSRVEKTLLAAEKADIAVSQLKQPEISVEDQSETVEKEVTDEEGNVTTEEVTVKKALMTITMGTAERSLDVDMAYEQILNAFGNNEFASV